VADRVTEESAARRLRLGSALRNARMEAKLTQAVVGDRLSCTQGKIQKIETTLVSVSAADLDAMLDLYAVPAEEAAELRDLARQTHRGRPSKSRPSTAWSAFGQLFHLEPNASEILCWHSERIPGPLQSEHYMLRQHPDTNTTPGLTALMKQRKARASIFTIENPPQYRAILSESSLLRMPGGRNDELTVDQAGHLLRLMVKHDQLTVQILPFEAKALFVDTDFQILRFAGEAPDFAYIEYPGGARTFRRPSELKQFEEHWNQLHKVALTREETKEFLTNLAGDVPQPPDAPAKPD
jgi:transcriptional regulator with XRE-family HTH domain